jgi:hypothetical protein
VPGLAVGAELVGVLIELLHVNRLEFFGVRIIEIRSDVSQVEIGTVLLRGQIDPTYIVDPLRLDQRASPARRCSECGASYRSTRAPVGRCG